MKNDTFLTRYIFSKRLFNIADGSIEPAAFMPKEGETSLANVTGLSEEEIWTYGNTKVAKKGGIKARGDVLAKHILRQDLLLEESYKSIHVNIKGWPSAESEMLLKATAIAQHASLVIAPE